MPTPAKPYRNVVRQVNDQSKRVKREMGYVERERGKLPTNIKKTTEYNEKQWQKR
jgi:hypothetical protein